jgi:hypothetical protein
VWQGKELLTRLVDLWQRKELSEIYHGATENTKRGEAAVGESEDLIELRTELCEVAGRETLARASESSLGFAGAVRPQRPSFMD